MEAKIETPEQQMTRVFGRDVALMHAVVALFAASPDRDGILEELPKIAQTLQSAQGALPLPPEYLDEIQSFSERICALVQKMGPWPWVEKTPR